MTDAFTEAPFSVNFKPATGFDAPMLTIRGSEADHLAFRVDTAVESGLLAKIGNLDKEFKAAYNVVNGLGATPAGAPSAPAPAADSWSAPAAAWGQQAPAAPAYAAPAAAPAASGSAGAPIIPAFGLPATFRSGQGAKGPWSAYMDPRPKQVTDALPVDHTGRVPSTDNVNHPGLAAGTHKFTQFIR